MTRLWQTAILAKWKEIFQFLPIESQIEKDQTGYYRAIDECHKVGKSDNFIVFMLRQINAALELGLIETMIPDKPRSRNQRYVKR